jgi:hypothetical protein
MVAFYKFIMMNKSVDPKEKSPESTNTENKSPEETKQEQGDPNLTELKGFIDPDEDLEPKGTDNDFDDE